VPRCKRPLRHFADNAITDHEPKRKPEVMPNPTQRQSRR